MADEATPAVMAPEAAPAVAPTPAPVAVATPETVAASPVTVEPVAPAVEPTPTPATEAASAESTPAEKPPEKPAEPITPKPSLLATAGEEDAASPEAPQQPAYEFEPFQLPEGLTLAEEEVGKFQSVLVDPELTPQQRGQQMIDMYVTEMQRLQRNQYDVFERTREGWREQFFSDPELGGNRQETTLRACAAIRDRFAGTGEHRREFIEAINNTGIGDHPAFIRFMHNIAKVYGEGRPVVPTQAMPLTPPSRVARRYQNTPDIINGRS